MVKASLVPRLSPLLWTLETALCGLLVYKVGGDIEKNFSDSFRHWWSKFEEYFGAYPVRGWGKKQRNFKK